MAHVIVGGVPIHYEVEGRGAPLVLHHGFTDSLVTWYEYGYVDALGSDHQLVLIDARGHGESDKPHDISAYAGDAMPLDVVAVLDQLQIGQSAFFGHSMGGGIGIALAHCAPTRFTALAIGGKAADPGTSETVKGFLPLLEEGSTAMLSAWQAQGELSPELTDRVLAIDCTAMIALFQADRQLKVKDSDVLARFPGRYRFFMGEKDWNYPDMCAALDRLAPGSLVSYPGLNHLECFQRCDLVVPDLRAFLDNVAVSGQTT
jgi:pimeloyl-ACP methyl ester carboxylesterase